MMKRGQVDRMRMLMRMIKRVILRVFTRVMMMITRFPPDEDKCASLDWAVINQKVARARKNLSLDIRQVEEKVEKVEKDVEKINTNLKRKVDSINTKIDDLLKRLKYL